MFYNLITLKTKYIHGVTIEIRKKTLHLYIVSNIKIENHLQMM